MCNRHLSIDNQIDHRSYERQGKLKVPTIHEGADARKIEEKYLTGQIRKGSWKVEENQMIKKQKLDQKDRTISELKVQLDESLTLNERVNSENRAGNIQALKDDLRKTKELLQSEKEKMLTAQAMIEECRGKLRQADIKQKQSCMKH